MTERCSCCGTEIPEGSQACPNCLVSSSVKYVKEPLLPDDVIEDSKETMVDLIRKSYAHAMAEGIRVNSVVINKNMVRVKGFTFGDPFGGVRIAPDMICGLNVYFTKDDLPENYSFALVNGPENRLAQFESIGMEPEELRKAAELYRRCKEVME